MYEVMLLKTKLQALNIVVVTLKSSANFNIARNTHNIYRSNQLYLTLHLQLFYFLRLGKAP